MSRWRLQGGLAGHGSDLPLAPPPLDMGLPPPPPAMNLHHASTITITTPGSAEASGRAGGHHGTAEGGSISGDVVRPEDRQTQRVSVADRAKRLSTPLPMKRLGSFQNTSPGGSVILPSSSSPNGSQTSSDSSLARAQARVPDGGLHNSSPVKLHSSGDSALSGNNAVRLARIGSASSFSQLPSLNSTASSGEVSPNVSKRMSMLVSPFRSPPGSQSPASISPPISPKMGADPCTPPRMSPTNRKTVAFSSSPLSSPSSTSSQPATPSKETPVNVLSTISPRNTEESPRSKNNVQVVSISGGGGGGVIKEMSASLLKTLLGGDNAKYPVDLDFSKGYLLTNDFFLASCPDIIKEINLSHNQLTECTSLSQLSRLKRLFLDNNKISDISFEGLENLKILSLMGNELEYLTSMSDLQKLAHLNLAGNKLTAGFHELGKLKSLQSLNLSNNSFNFTLRKFYSFILVPLKKHLKLQSLAISKGNPVATAIPHFRLWIVHELPQLKILDDRTVEKSELEEAARLEAMGVWADKDGDRLEKKAKVGLPTSFQKEATGRVVASHLNIGSVPASSDVDGDVTRDVKPVVVRADLNVGSGAEAGESPAPPTPPAVVRRPDLNVGGPDNASERPKNFRPDLNVSLGGVSAEEDSGSRKKNKKEKEKKEKSKKEKNGKGSGIKGKIVGRSRGGSEADDKERWPTDAAILAKIASSLPIPAPPATTASDQAVSPQRLSQQLTSSQNQFVSIETSQQPAPQAPEVSLETRIDRLRSFFLLDDLTQNLCSFALAAATPVWGPTEFLNLNNQLKQLVLHTKTMYERVQQYLQRYPFEEKRITDATVTVQGCIRGLVISVKQLNEAQARGGTVATTISSAKELTVALFRMFSILEEGVIPSTEDTAADIQECARGVMKLIQIATGISRELPIDQYSEILFQQSDRLSHQLNVKIPTLQNPEAQRRAAAATGSINGNITKLIDLCKQYQGDPNPFLLQEIRQTAQSIATEFQSLNTMVHTSRFASPLSVYDERVMYELCHQLLVEENNYVAIHEDAMLEEERKVLQNMKKLTELAGSAKALTALKPIPFPQLTQLVVEMSSEGVRACEQLHAVAANYADRGARDQLERYGRAIRYYSFLERVGLCSIILNFSAPDILHLATSMKGHAFCTTNAIKLILLSALTQAPQVGGVKRHSGVDFDELLTMLK